MTSTPHRRGRRLDAAVPVGLALIAVGGVLGLDAFEVVDAGQLLAQWWPVVVVAAGLWWLITGALALGVVAVAVGVLLLATTQDLVALPVGQLILPGLLVLLGVTLLRAGARVGTARGGARERGEPRSTDPLPTTRSATAVFGDARLRIDKPPAGTERVVVSATSVFGDVHVEVPTGWRIEEHITRVLGEVSVPDAQPVTATSPVVELHGVVVFGDVRVRHLAPEQG